MANEVTVPLLPCRSIDEIAEFYAALGFEQTYRQVRPNPYLALRREDLHLHFFGIPDFVAADSYGSCMVLVEDIGILYEAFAAGMRSVYGKVLVAGIPRMTRPRPRKNNQGLTGFAVIDPGGNWIRISASPAGRTAADAPTGQVAAGPAARAGQTSSSPAYAGPLGRLARAVENAVVIADSHGDHCQAAKILDAELARPTAAEDPVALVEALAYRAEIALTLGDRPTAVATLERVRSVELSDAERQRAESAFATIADLTAAL
jgi:hypothetical protein